MVNKDKIEKDFSTAMEHLQKYKEMAESYDDENLKTSMLKKIATQEKKLIEAKEKSLNGEKSYYSR